MDTSLWMARDLVTVTPDAPVAHGAREMARHRVRHLLVVDAANARRLVGIVSSHDLYLASESGLNPFSPHALAGQGRTIGAIMTPHPTSIPPSTPLAEAARILHDRKFGCLPVVDQGTLVGVLTENDILRAFLRWTGADQPGYEVTCAVTAGADALAELNTLAAAHGQHVVSASAFAHDGKHLLVVHFAGSRDDTFVDALWRCGHTILRVRATGSSTPAAHPAAH